MSQTTAGPIVGTWVHAARPKTLWAAVAPVLVGTAMAFAAGAHHWPSACFALTAAVLIQVGTNLSNDYLDYEKGADSSARKGPLRVTQAGLISLAAMKRATVLVFVLAFVSGLYLIYRGGIPILVVGLVSIIAGVLYTAGRYSLAYLGLADLAVLVFFGPVAVGGTYYVQALEITPLVLVAGLGPGLLATAILLVNNVRDVVEDRAANKRTLVVRLGREFGISLYIVCLVLAFALPVGIVIATGQRAGILVTLLAVPLAVRFGRTIKKEQDPVSLNQLLASTSQLLLIYCILLSVGWNI